MPLPAVPALVHHASEDSMVTADSDSDGFSAPRPAAGPKSPVQILREKQRPTSKANSLSNFDIDFDDSSFSESSSSSSTRSRSSSSSTLEGAIVDSYTDATDEVDSLTMDVVNPASTDSPLNGGAATTAVVDAPFEFSGDLASSNPPTHRSAVAVPVPPGAIVSSSESESELEDEVNPALDTAPKVKPGLVKYLGGNTSRSFRINADSSKDMRRGSLQKARPTATSEDQGALGLTETGFFDHPLLWADSMVFDLNNKAAEDVALEETYRGHRKRRDRNDAHTLTHLREGALNMRTLQLAPEYREEWENYATKTSINVVRALCVIIAIAAGYSAISRSIGDYDVDQWIIIVRVLVGVLFLASLLVTFVVTTSAAKLFYVLIVGYTLYLVTMIVEYWSNLVYVGIWSILNQAALYATGALSFRVLFVQHAAHIVALSIVFGFSNLGVVQTVTQIYYHACLLIIGSVMIHRIERTRKTSFVMQFTLAHASRHMERERERSEQMLLNIFPTSISKRLQSQRFGQDAFIADAYDNCTVLVADIVSFTTLSSRTSPQRLVDFLNEMFTAMDALCDEEGVGKIKTLGDAYVCAAGIPDDDPSHAQKVVTVALRMANLPVLRDNVLGQSLKLRIGVASGSALAGVIGSYRWAFDIYGQVIINAECMEANAPEGGVLIHSSTASLLPGYRFAVEPTTIYLNSYELKKKEPGADAGAALVRSTDAVRIPSRSKLDPEGKPKDLEPTDIDDPSGETVGYLVKFVDQQSGVHRMVGSTQPSRSNSSRSPRSGHRRTSDSQFIADTMRRRAKKNGGKPVSSTDGGAEEENELFHKYTKLNKISLRFKYSRMERTYFDYTFGRHILDSRLFYLSGIVLFVTLFVLDAVSNPGGIVTVIGVYLGVVALMGVSTGLTFTRFYSRVFELSGNFAATAASVGALVIISLQADSADVISGAIQRVVVILIWIYPISSLTFPSFAAHALTLLVASSVLALTVWMNFLESVKFTPADLSAIAICGCIYIFSSYRMKKSARIAFVVRRRVRYQGVVLDAQRLRSEQLLTNILPVSIAWELKDAQNREHRKLHHGHADDEKIKIAHSYDSASCIFIKIVGLSEHELKDKATLGVLNVIFSKFDRLAQRDHIEKIKTIGTTWMGVGNLPETKVRHELHMCNFALQAQQYIEGFTDAKSTLETRIGLSLGPCVAGVIGTKKFSFDLWGDTVNMASRMYLHGADGRIGCTEPFAKAAEREYNVTPRGLTFVKGKGNIPTYWLEGKIERQRSSHSVDTIVGDVIA